MYLCFNVYLFLQRKIISDIENVLLGIGISSQITKLIVQEVQSSNEPPTTLST